MPRGAFGSRNGFLDLRKVAMQRAEHGLSVFAERDHARLRTLV